MARYRNAGRQGTWRGDPLPASGARRGSAPAGVAVQPELSAGDDALLLNAVAARRHYGGTPLHDAWAELLQRHFSSGATFLTLSYSDEGGERFKAYRPAAVFGDVQRFLTALHYTGPAFFVCEPHQWRNVLHAHGLIHPLSVKERLSFMARWELKRGFARALPATAGAFPYCCKYALKEADQRAEYVDLRHLPTFQEWKR